MDQCVQNALLGRELLLKNILLEPISLISTLAISPPAAWYGPCKCMLLVNGLGDASLEMLKQWFRRLGLWWSICSQHYECLNHPIWQQTLWLIIIRSVWWKEYLQFSSSCQVYHFYSMMKNNSTVLQILLYIFLCWQISNWHWTICIKCLKNQNNNWIPACIPIKKEANRNWCQNFPDWQMEGPEVI